MNPDHYDWRGGRVAHWRLDDINPLTSLAAQADLLSEDMALVAYPGDIALDVGWYGDGAAGTFRVVVIAGQDWDRPVFTGTTCRVSDLAGLLQSAIEAAVAASRR